MKEGYKTTEFWVTLVTSIVGLLVLLGIITPDKSTEIVTLTQQIIASVMIIVPQIGYILSRGKAKSGGNIEVISNIKKD